MPYRGSQTFLRDVVPTLKTWLASENDRYAASAARILLRHDEVVPLLEAVHQGGSARLWALKALGALSEARVRADGGSLLRETVEDDLRPLWVSHRDWLRFDGEDGLEALDVQKVRFNPVDA